MKIALLTKNLSFHSNASLIAFCKEKNFNLRIYDPLNLSLNELLWEDIFFDITFTRTTGVSYDDFDLEAIRVLESKTKVMANPLRTHLFSRSKLTQYTECLLRKIPCLPFVSVRGKLSETELKILESFSGENYLVKPERSNQGRGITLLRGRDSLMSYFETMRSLHDERWIIQPFLSKTEEYRLFFVQGKDPIVLLKIKKGDEFKGNFFYETPSKLCSQDEIPREIFDISCQLQSITSAYYGAIDFLVQDDQVFVLDFNQAPGFKELEILYGIDLPKRLICQ